jgi:ribosomal protein S5
MAVEKAVKDAKKKLMRIRSSAAPCRTRQGRYGSTRVSWPRRRRAPA